MGSQEDGHHRLRHVGLASLGDRGPSRCRIFTPAQRGARRLGLAGILTLIALKKARTLGKNLAVLHSTPMAENLYRSLGFETMAEFRLFASKEVHI